jgi:hypothetical protein
MTHSALAEVKWGSIDFWAYPDRLDSQAGDRTPCVNFYVKKKKNYQMLGAFLISYHMHESLKLILLRMMLLPKQAYTWNSRQWIGVLIYLETRNITPKYLINGFQNTLESKISSNQMPPIYVHYFAWQCCYLYASWIRHCCYYSAIH